MNINILNFFYCIFLKRGNVRYIPPSPTTAYVNNVRQNRVSINQTICPHTNCTLIPEENQNENESIDMKECLTKSSSPYIDSKKYSNINSKKHVQFPDEIKCCSESSTLDEHNGNGHIILFEKISGILQNFEKKINFIKIYKFLIIYSADNNETILSATTKWNNNTNDKNIDYYKG